MKKTMSASLGAGMAATLLCAAAALAAQDAPKKDVAERQHQWLQQFVGDWALEAECSMPGKPAEKSKGTESVRALGDLWIVSETEGTFMGEPVRGMMTLGFDPERDKIIGTSVCNSSAHLWELEGTLDPTNKILTLECEGPHPMTGEKTRFKDVLEVKGPDENVLTSSMRGKDGSWVEVMTMTFRRAG